MSPNANNNQGRRMTDAVKIAQVEGSLALLQQETKTAIQNLGSSMQAVQAEMRAMNNGIHELTLAQAKHDAEREAITRLDQRISALIDELNTRDLKHTATHNEMFTRLTTVERRMSMWHGAIVGVMLLASTLIGSFVWYVNGRANEHAALIEYNRQRNEQLKDQLHRMELQLVNGKEPHP